MTWSYGQNLGLSVTVLVSSGLSVVGAASVLLVIWRASRRKAQLLTEMPMLLGLAHLCAADLLAALLIVLTAVVSLQDLGSTGANFGLCVYVFGLALHIAYRFTFLLTFAYAVQAWLAVQERGEQLQRFMLAVRLLCWSLPLYVTAFMFVGNGEGVADPTQPLCWCNEVLHVSPNLFVRRVTGTLYVPLLFAMLVNPVIYFFVFRTYKQHLYTAGSLTSRERAEVRRVMLTLTAYLTAFAVCWLPNFVELIIANASADLTREELYPLYVVQGALNPLQGFLNAIVIGWSNQRFNLKQHLLQSLS